MLILVWQIELIEGKSNKCGRTGCVTDVIRRLSFYWLAIHYSQTEQIRNDTIFLLNKILFAKTAGTRCYTPFVVRRQFSREHIRHWSTFVFVEETTTSMQILWTVYDKKPVCETWRTPTIHYLILSLFRRCLRIVYIGLLSRMC